LFGITGLHAKRKKGLPELRGCVTRAQIAVEFTAELYGNIEATEQNLAGFVCAEDLEPEFLVDVSPVRE
jgi:hypothetical protein